MSAMPAWSKTLDDEAIWDVVSFLRKMPDMTPQTYEQLLWGDAAGENQVSGGARAERVPAPAAATFSQE
jgi:hypothetical protein